MSKFIAKHRVLFILLVLFDLLVITLSLIHVKYDVTCPASIDSIEDTINIENETKLDGSINVVSVYSYERVSALSFLLGKLNPFASVDKSYEYYDLSYKDAYNGGVIQKRVSLYNAIIAGYKMAGYEINHILAGYIVHTKLSYCDQNIEIGDIITHVEGKELTNDYSLSTAINDNRDKIINESNHAITFTIIKNYGSNNETTLDYVISAKELETEEGKTYGFGISVYAYNIPLETKGIPSFNIEWNNIKSIGPSGGLLQGFYVYEKLTGARLSQGLRIAGTGTIDALGHAGPIGGIGQKIITAEYSNIDVFFVPVSSPNYEDDPNETNYIEAIAAYRKLKSPHMKLVPVWSLEEIIKYLSNY